MDPQTDSRNVGVNEDSVRLIQQVFSPRTEEENVFTDACCSTCHQTTVD